MQVFNGYIKVLRRSITSLFIYIGVFAVLLVIFSNSSNNSTSGTFEATKVTTAFINNDKDSALVADFKEYLEGYCEFIEIGSEKEELQDALFVRKVEYIITIDEGFEQRFLEGKVVTVDKMSVPDSQNGFYIDNAINMYFNTLKTYTDTMSELSLQDLCKLTRDTLKESVTINLIQEKSEADAVQYYNIFFNFLSYVMVGGFTACIGSIMLVFNDVKIRRRNVVAPISNKKANLQMVLANFIFAVAFFVIMLALGIAVNPNKVVTVGIGLNILNSFVFLFCALAISYIIGLTAKSESVVGSLSTIISLGLAFLSGAFVPQYLLSDTVIRIAKFTPNYWFVCVNDKIAEITTFTKTNVIELLGYMGIQLMFAGALFSIAIVISKKRSQRAE
ncbi:ABC transporter permease [Anaerosporobacter sp.]|uniref:ABC transporter permease n=1 Tax=Anaerosporobacter sp. TaxID=1872529 RepID=UPI00286F97D1|nr:ABC transporter permease [Anaerosporobacter sp.]